MSACDEMLEGTELIVALIEREEGPLAAMKFMCEFNNACSQIAGLEDMFEACTNNGSFRAPLSNLSSMEH